VLLAVVDASYNFIFVDIGGYGREGDAGLFHRSSFGQAMENNPTLSYDDGGLDVPLDNFIPEPPGRPRIKVPHVFLGDEAFPLGRHLMKPYRYQTLAERRRLSIIVTADVVEWLKTDWAS